MTQPGDAERVAMLEHCNDEIVALLREAVEDGVTLSEAVIVVADSHDALGKRVVEVCSELGQPISGADVYVVGVHLTIAEEILRRVAPDHMIDLYDDPPPNAAHLFCFAAGGVRSTYVAERPIGQA